MSITYREADRTFFLDGKNVTYAFSIDKYGYATHLYFGASVAHDDLNAASAGAWGRSDHFATAPNSDRSYHHTPTELSFSGTGDYREPAVCVRYADGVRVAEPLFTGYEILKEKPQIGVMPCLREGETLVIHLKDAINGFGADLFYTVYDNAVARRIEYVNGGSEKMNLDRAYSFAMSLPGQDYDAVTLYGGWANERSPERTPIRHGVVSIDSKRTSSSASLNPFLCLAAADTTEDHGEAVAVNLIYSSSYVLKAEGCGNGDTLLLGGVNDFDFSFVLAPGERFYAPEAVLVFSNTGFGGMSRALHDLYREHLINPRYVFSTRPLLINNWEGTYFNFNNEKLMAIVDAVEGTGIDTFVLDDGWFGVRNNDRSGLGDWFVNTDKLKGGLKSVIDHVHSKGMKFGLWFEPEMISEDSDIFRAHPEYAIGVPGRDYSRGRHQLVMDLTRADVRDYIVNALNSMIRDNGIDYVKWDYNRNTAENWSRLLPAERQQEFSYRYALGLYELCERIVEANPTVFFEGCSGGGARFDPAMLYYFPQIWTSDDSDAEERTKIQFGTSYAYPLSAMSCHVSECPNHQTGRTTPFATRADIAHLGATGYELDTTKFTDEDKAAVRKQVADYRRMEQLVLSGDLYRIDDPFHGNFFAEEIVSKDKTEAVLVCYRRMGGVNNEPKRIRLKGLDAQKTYFVEEKKLTAHGSTLMNLGFCPDFARGDFQSVCYHISEAKQ